MSTLDLQVGASADDCRVYWNGSSWVLGLTDTYPYVGYAGSTQYKGGMGLRFTNVTIPPGATISTAYLTVKCSFSSSVTTVNSTIKGEATDNAAQFSDYANYNGRARTTASANWNSIPAWTLDTDYNSPELKTIIQEIVNRAGWVSGNALVIFWDDHADNSTHTNNCARFGYSYDQSTTKAIKLHIEYTAAAEKISSDTGSGADAYVSLVIVEAKSSSDAGSGVEGTPVSSASLSASEAGSGIEVLVARLLVAVDSGTGIEAAQLVGLLNDLFATDWGEGLDLLVAKIEMPTKGGGMKLWT